MNHSIPLDTAVFEVVAPIGDAPRLDIYAGPEADRIASLTLTPGATSDQVHDLATALPAHVRALAAALLDWATLIEGREAA